jgi:acetyl esterase/lipase
MKEWLNIPYGSHGERNLADLYLPEPCAVPAPLVLCVHGGGWRGGSRDQFRWAAEGLTQLGFAVALVTYRFWPAAPCPAAMDDVQRAIRWLRRRAGEYRIDPLRFGGMGGSAGGHLVSYAALMETRDNSDPDLAPLSSRLQCAVDCCGPVDLPAMMASASAPIVEGFMGKPLAGAEEEYRRASPHWLVGVAPPPFLLVHGTEDKGVSHGQVPIGQSENFCARLTAAGGEATLLRLAGAGHGFVNDPQHRATLRAAAVPFLQRHLRLR